METLLIHVYLYIRNRPVFIANGMFLFASNLRLCCLMHLLSSVSTSITSHIGFTEALVIRKRHFPE